MRLMSWILAFVLVGCAGTPKHLTWSNATGAEQYERLMWKAIQNRDWKELNRHLAPIFTGVTASGQVLDRAGWINHWQTEPLAGYSLAELTVVPEGQDMVVSYILQIGGAPDETRVLSVWQDIKGRWTLISTAIIPVK
jgi:Domain of unknown function (DUF4440)